MLIPKPLDVDAAIRKVPRGKVVTLTQLREKLARAAEADVTCPMVAGMFVRIAAEAACDKAPPRNAPWRTRGARAAPGSRRARGPEFR